MVHIVKYVIATLNTIVIAIENVKIPSIEIEVVSALLISSNPMIKPDMPPIPVMLTN